MNKDDQGDNKEETESINDSIMAALNSIKTGQSNDEDSWVVVDQMGPATEDELNEHELPQAWHTMAAQREGAIECVKTKINRKWYEQMQQNNITECTMEDILHMQHQPPFNHNTLTNSVHMLSEAGQWCIHG
ncbi:uncharacterized protein ACA1_326710 [Acanthamoeba castellanii str. Neff]|uniref:Uncharacterized protein n=1 Tax=Acanthamoeba castellanii (strain ATCC 30010 / Neff) TaxID=1257118 RepID=L8HM28_ACACF|nr:uncharacterized protein ACA1_326710 [Acanthamoeba castellanii str. Neff]ELR25713.1 hypothetical protein ACA1_326710 [Acanthamoeba castellanii str. Neff]